MVEFNCDKEECVKNHKLKIAVVELSAIWDGKESGKYGKTLQITLDKLGIKDIPEYFSEEFDEFLDKQKCLDCGQKIMQCKCDPNEYKDWGKKWIVKSVTIK